MSQKLPVDSCRSPSLAIGECRLYTPTQVASACNRSFTGVDPGDRRAESTKAVEFQKPYWAVTTPRRLVGRFHSSELQADDQVIPVAKDIQKDLARTLITLVSTLVPGRSLVHITLQAQDIPNVGDPTRLRLEWGRGSEENAELLADAVMTTITPRL